MGPASLNVFRQCRRQSAPIYQLPRRGGDEYRKSSHSSQLYHLFYIYATKFERIALSGVEPESLNEYDTAHSSATDMKTIHYLEDQAERISNLITLNMETIGCLLRQAKRLKSRGPSSNRGMLTQFEDRMQKIKQDHRFIFLNVSAIIKRAKTVSEQVGIMKTCRQQVG